MAKSIHRSGPSVNFPDQTAPDRIVRTSDDPEAPELFVDGAVEIMTGSSVSRVTFYTVVRVNPDEAGRKPVEQRRVSLRLIIPTPNLLELSANIANAVLQSSDAVMTASRGFETAVRELTIQKPTI